MKDFPEVHVKPEYAEIRKWAREFAVREIVPVADKIDRTDEYPMQLAKKMGQYGLMGLNVPQEYGGLGLELMGREKFEFRQQARGRNPPNLGVTTGTGVRSSQSLGT